MMAQNTKIQWAHHTFNPWRGCTKVSAGCANCYAETMSKRNPAVLGEWGDNGTRVIAKENYWKLPLKWNVWAASGICFECGGKGANSVKHPAHTACPQCEGTGKLDGPYRARVFCASLGDVFEDRPELEQPRVRLFHLINETPNLDWLLLTKRPENVQRFHGGDGVKRSWAENMPPNVWLGTSVENQEQADNRIPHLLRTPAAIRFLSCEPLLEEVNITRLSDDGNFASPGVDCLDWVIIGGESGHGARPCNLEWIRSIVNQCKAAGVAAFVKQAGSNPVVSKPYIAGVVNNNYTLQLKDKKGGDLLELPEELQVREVPK